MKGYILELYSQLENELHTIELEVDNNLKSSEIAFRLCVERINELKVFVLGNDFLNQDEEILFFKTVKPRFNAKIIYYNKVFNIETSRPTGSVQAKEFFLNFELEKVKHFFENNIDFYRYYRSGNTVLDHNYFLRGKYDIRLKLDSRFNDYDQNFSTSHDHIIAKIIAFDLLQVYLENQLSALKYQVIEKPLLKISKKYLKLN